MAVDLVEPACRDEVVGIALHGCANAGLPFLENIGAGADAGLPVDRAVVLRRHDRDMIVAGDVGEVGIAAGKLEDDRCRPSALMSAMASTSDLAADFESLPMWWRKEATTSVGVTVLPLWKVTPLRSLNTQFLASSPGSKLSARSGMMRPLASTSVRLLPIVPQPTVPVI